MRWFLGFWRITPGPSRASSLRTASVQPPYAVIQQNVKDKGQEVFKIKSGPETRDMMMVMKI